MRSGLRWREKLVRTLLIVSFLAPIGLPIQTTQAQASSARGLITEVAAVGTTVSDMDRSLDFYSKVLSFEKVSDVEVWGSEYERLQGVFGLRMRVVRLQLGDEFIELMEYLAPKGRPIPVDSRSHDRWFQHIAIIVSDMDRAYQLLRRHKVEHASSGPQRLPDWNTNAAGIRAFYFKDPDGHHLEILQFPPDKGDPKWRRATDRLFLGIDHTAIVVADTDASLKFYRDLLELRVAGESENYGTEQEHLNNVFGARLRITGLRAASGPGIEFLEYLTPGGGRPIPADQGANDLAHWQTTLVTPDASAAAERGLAAKHAFVSPGVVSLRDRTLGFARGFLIRDPDGHVMQVVER
jgi:catechol 2,3-dioxygenase-like lactoylglutathione lyase family enzyme